MTVDIRGINTHNKGAHLMLLAVVDRLGESTALSTSPNGSAYSVRSRLGLGQTVILNQAPQVTARLSNLVPRSAARNFGLIRDKDVTGVLDAAGFAYSDSFTSERSRREARHARRWSRRGVPIVALPQAFGPFTNAERSRWAAAYLQHAKIAFARDDQSQTYLRNLLPGLEVRRAPDFTVGLAPARVDPPVDEAFAALVPNGKIISQGVLTTRGYTDQLVRSAHAAVALGLLPVVVVHETGDLPFAAAVAEKVGAPIVTESDPLVLKGILGKASLTVASRFHALVSAMSQGVPSIALGWSHKYAALMADFDVPELLHLPEEDLGVAVMRLATDATVSDRLAFSVERLKAQNEKMWELTIDALFTNLN